MAKKLWSISTTLRNPERIRDFLITLSDMDGMDWNKETQCEFQARLIMNRFYGTGNSQFTNSLNEEHKKIILDLERKISLEEAIEIFNSKNYEDPAMRGRTSFAPLKEMGLARIKDNKIIITDIGKTLMKKDYDLGELFLQFFLKWQYPNLMTQGFSDGFNIKPFIAVLHLINKVNLLWEKLGNKPVGISKIEFKIFALSLINFNDIDTWAEKVIEFRLEDKKQPNDKAKREFKAKYTEEFLTEYENRDNASDYTDNAIRYFRLTRYFYLRGNGYYIDIEPRRMNEISKIMELWNGSIDEFKTKEDYEEFLSSSELLKLPWENKDTLIQIINGLLNEINENLQLLNRPNLVFYISESEKLMKSQIEELREIRKSLKIELEKIEFSQVEKINEIIYSLKNIKKLDMKPSIALEKWSALALNVINDALKIAPNYPIGDDYEPTFTAPANKPDIECYYSSFNSICEVTMLVSRDQWFNEGQPVMRHLRDFEDNSTSNINFALFIAPTLHRDTLNTFWMASKYEYEGNKQKIIPLTINNLVEILTVILEFKTNKKQFTHIYFKELLDNINILVEKVKDSAEWQEQIPKEVKLWKNKYLKYTS